MHKNSAEINKPALEDEFISAEINKPALEDEFISAGCIITVLVWVNQR